MIAVTFINIVIITTAVIVHYECLLRLNLLQRYWRTNTPIPHGRKARSPGKPTSGSL